MRSVIISDVIELGNALGVRCTSGQAQSGIWLVPAHQSLQHIVLGCKYVTHIVKNRKAKTFSQIRQRSLGKTQFQVVHKQRRAADWETGRRIARACLIQPKSAVRVAPTRKKLFLQWDGGNAHAGLFPRYAGWARSRRENLGPSEGLFEAHAGRTRKHKLMPRLSLAKHVIAGILAESASEIGFRAKISGSGEAIEREVVSLCALEGIVPLVVNKGETRASDTGGKRQNRNLIGREPLGEVAGLHPTKIPAIGKRIRPRASPRPDTGVSELLPQVDLAFEPLGCKRCHVQAVVVENRVNQFEFVVVE